MEDCELVTLQKEVALLLHPNAGTGGIAFFGTRIYLEESLSGSGAFTDALEDDMADLQQILALGVREAEDLRSEIVSKTYKCAKLLDHINSVLSLLLSVTCLFDCRWPGKNLVIAPCCPSMAETHVSNKYDDLNTYPA